MPNIDQKLVFGIASNNIIIFMVVFFDAEYIGAQNIWDMSSMTKPDNEPIAIIGIGCRFPGNASDPQKF